MIFQETRTSIREEEHVLQHNLWQDRLPRLVTQRGPASGIYGFLPDIDVPESRE